jgi:hypothetical protein
VKPKVYTDIGINEARSPLVRVVDAGEWDLLMTELRYLQGERAAVVAWLRAEAAKAGASPDEKNMLRYAVQCFERGEHRREEER